jgi:hypothetical protein
MTLTPKRVQERRQLFLTLILSILIPLVDAFWGLTAGSVGGPVFEEDLHMIGRVTGALHFTAVYVCIMVRLLISTHYRARIFLLPALALLIILGAVATGLFVHYRDREVIQLGQFSLDGFSLRQIGSGVISMIPSMGIVMVLSPVFIPSYYLHRMGELFGKDVRTGNGAFDEYLSFRKKNKAIREKKQEVIPAEFLPKPSAPPPQPEVSPEASPLPPPPEVENPPDVLLVEDDLNCATLVLKFCKKIKLDCHHVEDLKSAKLAYAQFRGHLRLIILDNFVRVGEGHQDGDAKTGSEWAKEINQEFGGQKRPFHMAILSGHTHLLQELAKEADLVLQKPWEPQALFRYLKDNDVV